MQGWAERIDSPDERRWEESSVARVLLVEHRRLGASSQVPEMQWARALHICPSPIYLSRGPGTGRPPA